MARDLSASAACCDLRGVQAGDGASLSPDSRSSGGRSSGGGECPASRIREADRPQAVADSEVLDDVLAASVVPRRFQIGLFAAFTSLAVVLALTGIFGIVTHGVGQRTREIAVRLAFGAHRRQVVAAAVVRQLGFALGGIALGAAAMLMAAPMLEPLVDQVSPRDPTSFVVVVGLLGTASIAMATSAAARVAHVSPMTLLKG